MLTIQHINHKTALSLAKAVQYVDIIYHYLFFRNYKLTGLTCQSFLIHNQVCQEVALKILELPAYMFAQNKVTAYISFFISLPFCPLPFSHSYSLLSHSPLLPQSPFPLVQDGSLNQGRYKVK